MSSQAGTIRIELAYPPPQLSPNRRYHHMERWRFQKAARDTAYWLTRAALGHDRFEHDGGDIPVRVTFNPIKGKARPDDDNALASMKHSLDGIALGLGVDDKHFRPSIEWAEPVPGGKVVVEIGGAG